MKSVRRLTMYSLETDKQTYDKKLSSTLSLITHFFYQTTFDNIVIRIVLSLWAYPVKLSTNTRVTVLYENNIYASKLFFELSIKDELDKNKSEFLA